MRSSGESGGVCEKIFFPDFVPGLIPVLIPNRGPAADFIHTNVFTSPRSGLYVQELSRGGDLDEN